MCDMCSSPESVYRIELEGTMLNVCENCAAYGRIVAKLRKDGSDQKKQKKKTGLTGTSMPSMPLMPGSAPEQERAPKESETVQVINQEYPIIIKKKREQRGLKQEELAKKIAEKESVIHKLESGRMKPSIALARKLERFLRIRLVEEVELDPSESYVGESKDLSKGLTFGDIIKKKADK